MPRSFKLDMNDKNLNMAGGTLQSTHRHVRAIASVNACQV